MKSSRMIIVALAVAAILAPTAAARPIDGPVNPVTVDRSASPQGSGEMRASVAKLHAKQREAKQRLLPGPPAMPINPQPITPPKAAASNTADDGVDWATIGIGVGLTFVALGLITGVTHRIRVRQQRPRAA
jgi:hypothetical protein